MYNKVAYSNKQTTDVNLCQNCNDSRIVAHSVESRNFCITENGANGVLACHESCLSLVL